MTKSKESPICQVKRIGVIGGGASGVLAALHCWELLGSSAEILIFEPRDELGRGRAYSTIDKEYLLNVPVSKMSAFTHLPDDFADWLKDKYPEIQGLKYWPFVPRVYYGEYLQDRLKTISPLGFRHIKAQVNRISQIKKGYRISLDNGSVEIVQYLILATGYQNLQAFEFSNHLGRLKSHVLQASEIDSQPTTHFSGHVLVIGSGLTALDIWKRLEGNASLKITFLSRHGFLPLSHEPIAQRANIPQLAGMSPLQIVQVLRCVHLSSTESWAAIADEVRSQAQMIWACWTEVERKRFLRHLKSYWEVIRHRMPATLYQEVKNAITEKRLEVLAGRITRISEELGQIKITYNDRHENVRRELWANWIFLATGLSVHQGLILHGEIPGVHPCPYGFGYINESAARLWTLGPASKSTFWEITAIPDIRDQARTIAEAIARDQTQHQALSVLRILSHPKSVGESYLRHLRHSVSFCLNLLKLSWYSLAHAIVPFAYVDKVSNGVRNLQSLLSKRQQRASANFERT